MIDDTGLFLPTYKDSHKIVPDAILVDAPRFSGDVPATELQQLAGLINKQLTITEKNKVIFCIESEGFPESNLRNFNYTAKFLNTTDVAILSGAVYTETNVNLYRQYIKSNDWIIKQFWFANLWEISSTGSILNDISFYENLNNTFSKKTKKALCQVRVARPHRLSIISNIIKENLLDKCYVSCYLFNKEALQTDPTLTYLSQLLPNISTDIIKTLTEHVDKFPMELSLDKRSMNIFNISDDRIYYEDSYFSIIPESKFFHDSALTIQNQEITMDVIMLSEKTYKPISAKHPFVMASYTGSLKALRQQGYQTFHPYINESYDLIENDEERMIAVNKEITRLCNLTDDDWEIMYEKLLPIVHHNYRILKSATYVPKKVDYNDY